MTYVARAHVASILIRKLESIGPLSDGEQAAITSLPVKIQTFSAHQDIIHDGDTPAQCCLILGGWACRYKLLDEGKRQILSFHIPGDIPDLQSLYLPAMDHGVSTTKRATVAFIPHECLRELTERLPSLAAHLWREILIDAAIQRVWMAGLGRRSACQRIAHLFCELYMKLQAVGLAGNGCCPMPVTQTDLADALGLTPVHVNRVLRDLRDGSLITLRGGMLAIDAWDELTRVAEFDPRYLQLGSRAASRIA